MSNENRYKNLKEVELPIPDVLFLAVALQAKILNMPQEEYVRHLQNMVDFIYSDSLPNRSLTIEETTFISKAKKQFPNKPDIWNFFVWAIRNFNGFPPAIFYRQCNGENKQQNTSSGQVTENSSAQKNDSKQEDNPEQENNPEQEEGTAEAKQDENKQANPPQNRAARRRAQRQAKAKKDINATEMRYVLDFCTIATLIHNNGGELVASLIKDGCAGLREIYNVFCNRYGFNPRFTTDDFSCQHIRERDHGMLYYTLPPARSGAPMVSTHLAVTYRVDLNRASEVWKNADDIVGATADKEDDSNLSADGNGIYEVPDLDLDDDTLGEDDSRESKSSNGAGCSKASKSAYSVHNRVFCPEAYTDLRVFNIERSVADTTAIGEMVFRHGEIVRHTNFGSAAATDEENIRRVKEIAFG